MKLAGIRQENGSIELKFGNFQQKVAIIGTSIKTDILRSKILQNIELQNRVESQLQQVVLNMCPCPAPKAVLYSFKQLSCVTQHHQIWALVQNIATAERKTVLCRFEKFFFDIPIFKRFSVDTNL